VHKRTNPSVGLVAGAQGLRSLGFALVVLLLPSCTPRHSADTTDASSPNGPIAECEEYAARYEACLAAAGTQEIAHQRAQATRDAFAAAVRDGNNLTELRKTCAAGLARLHCR
jgi:hypothetical protein